RVRLRSASSNEAVEVAHDDIVLRKKSARHRGGVVEHGDAESSALLQTLGESWRRRSPVVVVPAAQEKNADVVARERRASRRERGNDENDGEAQPRAGEKALWHQGDLRRRVRSRPCRVLDTGGGSAIDIRAAVTSVTNGSPSFCQVAVVHGRTAEDNEKRAHRRGHGEEEEEVTAEDAEDAEEKEERGAHRGGRWKGREGKGREGKG